jgi:sugar phosphate isomerase/epimerase
MKLILFRHLWGVTGPLEENLPKFQAAGYGGIECGVLPVAQRRLLAKHGFKYIAMIFTSGQTVAEHVASFRKQVNAAARLDPMLINAHSGRDCWNAADSATFFEQALAIEAAAGLPIAHETHRGRILFTPWTTADLLRRFPALHLCCDFSHWVCASERLLDDQLPAIQLAASRCRHIHARVGYEEGPQVPDPRAPEYQRHLQAHERWWRLVWKAQRAAGVKVSTLTPEFGPPNYLHTLPFTKAPVANLAEICDWQARRQAAHFNALR